MTLVIIFLLAGSCLILDEALEYDQEAKHTDSLWDKLMRNLNRWIFNDEQGQTNH